jgi:hypothetical protein
MWTAFPSSDYYAGSAPPDTISGRCAFPSPTWLVSGRGVPDGSHVHLRTACQGRRPAVPLRPRHGYATVFPHGLRSDLCESDQESSRSRTRACVASSAHIHQVGAGPVLRGFMALVSRVHLSGSLAEPGRSGSSHPSRRCQGCLPSFPAPPGSNCPQLCCRAVTGQQRTIPGPHGSKAPRGADGGTGGTGTHGGGTGDFRNYPD